MVKYLLEPGLEIWVTGRVATALALGLAQNMESRWSEAAATISQSAFIGSAFLL